MSFVIGKSKKKYTLILSTFPFSRTLLDMRFTRVGVKSKIGHTTRVDAYVCLTLHAGRVKRVKCVKRAILGKIRELHFLGEAPLNSP